ncbi:alpha/beta hydrolase-fold protein [Lancefieldella parvula]|uniref:alpha/beta hydrolase-fold protein n=1 Tax=Lancefieldella parvula TaxID=1382 RepID=UPI00290CF73A|nr:alpha/beta hydrolase-fold protein [Lancefieldella parvula]MDU4868096.1 alpha/beta hydrolase-fold protein [Lancefieldella parvula]
MSSTPDTRPVTDATTHPAIDAVTQSAKPTARKTTISGFSVHTKMSSVAGAPVVYLLGNVADNSPVQVPESVSLVTVGVNLWEQNFSPWCAPRVFAKGPNFGDGAQKTLDTLIDQIIPWAESELTEPPKYRVLVGYSLAGLFSLWAGVSQSSTSKQAACGCQPCAPASLQLSATAAPQPDDTPIIATFQRIGSVSGSFWFPGLLDYVDHQLSAKAVGLTHAYLSLGDREARTPNPQIMHVRENAELLANKLVNAGITSTFELNRGNHFQNVEGRMQKALDWLLK